MGHEILNFFLTYCFLLPFENRCKVSKDEFAFQTESILGLVGFSPFLCVIRSFYLLTTLHLWSSASHWITESNTFVCLKGITVKQGGLIGWVSLRYISSPNHLSRLQQGLLEQSLWIKGNILLIKMPRQKQKEKWGWEVRFSMWSPWAQRPEHPFQLPLLKLWTFLKSEIYLKYPTCINILVKDNVPFVALCVQMRLKGRWTFFSPSAYYTKENYLLGCTY